MPAAREVVVQPARALRGALPVPGDKSISHRYALLAALADGPTRIANYSPGADCASTLACLEALGVPVRRGPVPGDVEIDGLGLGGLRAATGPLDCGNSGSTMRMLAGVLAAHPFRAVLTGDASLSRRPMGRVLAPLARMGATVEAGDGQRPPIAITGGRLAALTHAPEVPSAQVKTAVLLAGLHAPGRTTVTEPAATRDHTEHALRAFGVPVVVDGRSVSVDGGHRLQGGLSLRVPGDPSSAAFWAVAAAALAGSRLTIEGVGLNPSRTGVFDVLRRAGARIAVQPGERWHGEPVGDVTIEAGALVPVELVPADVPGVIDELPVLAALATFAGGLRVTGAGELRVKESDRITALVAGLQAMGADASELPDGFDVRAGRRLNGGTVDAHGDHRLAMAFAVAALGASGPTTIRGADVVAVSYPGFFAAQDRLRA
jgi:3-phosphoshikimate 1-carboxyvinyltransferase